MIVDDNPENLKMLERMLVRQGHEVRSFPRGRLALVAAAKNPPDLILLDVIMPEMDGYEVCARLKATAGLEGIPVIFLSALSETEDKLKAFESGAVDYISKPFQLEEVHHRVDTHVRLHQLQRALTLQNERLEEAVAARTHELARANARLTLLDHSYSFSVVQRDALWIRGPRYAFLRTWQGGGGLGTRARSCCVRSRG